MASDMHDRNTRLNIMSSDDNVPLGRTHYMRISFIYRGAIAWNALPNYIKNSGSLSAFKINLKHYIKTLGISTCMACIIVVLFYQGFVEKQLFIAVYITLNTYISTTDINYRVAIIATGRSDVYVHNTDYFPLWLSPVMSTFPSWLVSMMAIFRHGYFPFMATSHYGYFPLGLFPL